MIEVLKNLIHDFSYIQEHEIKDAQGLTLGFQSTLITNNSFPFAGGTADSLNMARRICTAEALERATFFKTLKLPDEHLRLLLNEYPTTCGFAAGFDEKKVIYRAVCEAVERWAWSKWIDSGLSIPRVKPNLKTELSRYFLSEFDDVIFLKMPVKLCPDLVPKYIARDLFWSVALGVKENGIFPGSRVSTEEDETWEHSILEAWRHKNIFKNELLSEDCEDLFDKRIQYFGKNKDEALKQCGPFALSDFPAAKLRILEKVVEGTYSSNKYFVYRALCEDYIGWQCGDETRFVY